MKTVNQFHIKNASLVGVAVVLVLLAISIPTSSVRALSCLNPSEMINDYVSEEQFDIARVVAGAIETGGDKHNQTVTVSKNLKGETSNTVSFSYNETWNYMCAGNPIEAGSEAVYVTSEGMVVQVINLNSPLYDSLVNALGETPEETSGEPTEAEEPTGPEEPSVAEEKTKRTLMQRVIGLLQQMITLLRNEANPPTTEPEAEATPEDLIGMTTAKATTYAAEHDLLFRIVEIDGEPQPTTKDYRPGRINAAVENGVVVSYKIEGEDTPAEAGAHDKIIGMTQAEAEAYAAGIDAPFRIGRIDGEYLAVTMDYRPGRITAEIDDGVVSEYSVE